MLKIANTLDPSSPRDSKSESGSDDANPPRQHISDKYFFTTIDASKRAGTTDHTSVHRSNLQGDINRAPVLASPTIKNEVRPDTDFITTQEVCLADSRTYTNTDESFASPKATTASKEVSKTMLASPGYSFWIT